MKALGVVALVLGLAAVGVAVYGLVETMPNYEYFRDLTTGSMPGQARTQLDYLLYTDYRDTLTMQGIAALACGGVALVTGLLGALKGKNALGWGGVVLGVAGAVMGAMLFP